MKPRVGFVCVVSVGVAYLVASGALLMRSAREAPPNTVTLPPRTTGSSHVAGSDEASQRSTDGGSSPQTAAPSSPSQAMSSPSPAQQVASAGSVGLVTWNGVLQDRAGTPIGGVDVSLGASGATVVSATTAADGSFSLHAAPGSYAVNVSCSDQCGAQHSGWSLPQAFKLHGAPIDLTGDLTQDLTLQNVFLTVTVVDPLGDPIPGVEVTAPKQNATSFLISPGLTVSGYSWDDSLSAPKFTDASGTAQLALFPTSADISLTPASGSGVAAANLGQVAVSADSSMTVTIVGGVTCSVTVPSGGNIQSALNQHAGGVVRLAGGGVYSPTTTLKVPSGTELTTAITPVGTIRCRDGTTAICVDAHGTTGARIDHVNLSFSGSNDPGEDGIRGGNATTMGPGLSISGAGRFGIVMNQTAGDVVTGANVSGNATNCGAYGGVGYCGGIKSNATNGTVVENSTVSSNGSNGIWFDINSQGSFSINGNTSDQNKGDGIRVEISCFGSLSGNTVGSNLGTGIHLVNSNNISVGTSTSRNDVTTTGGNDGITVVANGRPVGHGGTGDGSCAGKAPPGSQPNGTFYYNFNNTVSSNTVTMTSGTKDGFWTTASATGLTYSDSFSGNIYLGGQASAKGWNWGSGSTSQLSLTFPGWQTKGQDTNGTMLPTSP
jgi:hypothetical protein